MKLVFKISIFLLSTCLCGRTWSDSQQTQAPAPEGGSHTAHERKDNAQEPVYKLSLAQDAAAVVLGGVVAASWLLGDEFGSAYCAPLCEKAAVNAMDRFAAGNYHQTWARVSDATLITSLVSGLLVVGLDDGFPAALTDGLVVAESVILANAAIVLLNLATRRPRPYLYSEDTPLHKRERGYAAFSFPSGHVGATAAVTSAVFGWMHLRHPRSPWKWVLLGTGTVATGLVAAGRVLSGRHFLTDVVAGAAIGAGMGILVPALHQRNATLAPMVSTSGIGLSLFQAF